MNNDIPLQTTPGDYRPSWLRRNRWWLAVLGVTFGLMVVAGLVTTGPGPTKLTVRVVVSSALPVEVEPAELEFDLSTKDKDVIHEIGFTNTSDRLQPVRMALINSEAAGGAAIIPGADGLITSPAPAQLLATQFRAIEGMQHISCRISAASAQGVPLPPGRELRVQLTCRSTDGGQGGSLVRLILTQ